MSDDIVNEPAATYGETGCRSEFAPLIDVLYREEVLRARKMSLEEKLISGERLFRWACSITLEGIRFQNPTASENESQQMLRQRIELGKKLESL